MFNLFITENFVSTSYKILEKKTKLYTHSFVQTKRRETEINNLKANLEQLQQQEQVLKLELEETKQIIKKAEEKGWDRQVEMNRKVENNLEKIINTLETKNKEIILGLEE